jgi:hypothetical protein
MKVSNFNGNFLPNKQNKEQKSNLQNKALNQNSMSFKGSAANDSLSAMGQAQVNMNKSKNIAFKGRPPLNILSNIAEKRHPEQLRELSQEFGRKVTKYYPSEQHFDKAVIDHIFDKSTKRVNETTGLALSQLAFNKSSMTDLNKFKEHVVPNAEQVNQYAKTHPAYAMEYRQCGHDRLNGLGNAISGGVTVLGSLAAAPHTGGISLGGVITGAKTYAEGLSKISTGNAKKENLLDFAKLEFTSGCLDYKLKRLIAKDKLDMETLLAQVDPSKLPPNSKALKGKHKHHCVVQ